MPGGRDAVRGGVKEKYDVSSTFVPEEAEGSNPVQGVRGVDGSRVAGGTHEDAV